ELFSSQDRLSIAPASPSRMVSRREKETAWEGPLALAAPAGAKYNSVVRSRRSSRLVADFPAAGCGAQLRGRTHVPQVISLATSPGGTDAGLGRVGPVRIARSGPRADQTARARAASARRHGRDPEGFRWRHRSRRPPAGTIRPCGPAERRDR